MNGQQLTNSSNSANGTPSSSYPASLSSQSSRDPSPATRPGAPRKPFPESYNHAPVINSQPNHWTSKNPANDAHSIPTSLHSSQPAEFREEPKSTFPPTSQFQQPVYRFPPSPTPAQSNHLPSNNPQYPTHTNQSTDRSRSSQSPVQQPPKQYQAPPTFQSPPSNNFSQQPKQFSQLTNPPQQPSQFSQLPNQYQQLSNQLPSQQPNQFLQPQLNQFPQQPSQLSHPPVNQFQKPVMFQSQQNQSQRMATGQGYEFNLPNQAPQPQIPALPQPPIPALAQPPISPLPQPPVPALPPQNKFASSPIQPYQNQFPPSNQFGPPPNQMLNPPTHTQPLNQFSQPPIQASQPANHLPAPPGPGHNPLQPPYPQPQQRYATPIQQQPPNQFNKRYPQMAQQPGYQPCPIDGLAPQVAGMSIQQGFNKMWGMNTVDLLKCRDLLPPEKLEPPAVRLQHELYEAANCSPEIFRCTLTKIPETKSLLDKSRLPLGVLIHPFKDLNQLSVIQCTVIVRCRMCRTYINPFVYFVDNKRWKCNLCFRVNELPDEFQFDPMTKTYGDPSRRPEIKSATIEFIAPSEYMVRPPQPAIYVFVLDVSRLACESGYLQTVCRTLLAELENVPGDARTSVAFITFDSAVHFYSLTEGQGQPHQMIVVDIDDMFLPTPDNLLVSLNECRELIRDLLQELPEKYKESYDTHSALGAALQAAYKLLAPTGGRVTVFQACLPNAGPGALTAREDPAQRAGDNPPHLNPATDFYKKLALDCSGQQIAVDLFLVNRQYVDLATLSGVSRFSGGCMHHLPLYSSDKPLHVDALERMFQRYLTRKIGFESVMRLRCTRGLSIHTFHGNFFVRSTDLLSLPNANPDAGFGMQVSIEENLTEIQNVCFQAALLYTSSKGERRIRVHTLCLPVASNLADIIHGADQQCIVGLLAKMAVDRAIQSSLSDAREAFVNVVADTLSTYKATQSGNTVGCLMAPSNLQLLPLYILALLKHTAFRVGQSTRLDDRLFAMCQMKSLPLTFLMQSIYPDLYCVTHLEKQPEVEGVHRAPRLQLSSERVDSLGLYLLDDGVCLMLYVGHNLDPAICHAVFDVPNFSAIPPELYSLPELDSPMSTALRNFITFLQNEKPYPLPLQVIRDDNSHHRMRFLERLIEDKNESGTSYYEFLKRIQALVK